MVYFLDQCVCFDNVLRFLLGWLSQCTVLVIGFAALSHRPACLYCIRRMPVAGVSILHAQEEKGEQVMLPVSGLPTVWLHGEPVNEFAKGKLYIFAFWATGCGPCLQAMPHMEQLQPKWPDARRAQ